MSDLTDKLQTAVDALKTASDAIAAAVTDASGEAASPADAVLSTVVSSLNSEGLVTVFGADVLSSALTDAGYAVTASEVTDDPELPSGEAEGTDTAS